jgi:hypothetical protein
MITKWFKQAMKANNVVNSGTAYAFNLPFKNIANQTRYMAAGSYFQIGNPTGLQLSANGWGISVGTSDTAATDEDVNLASTITSGLTGVITNTHGMDGDDPYVLFNIVLTNSTTSDIIIKEVGFKQNVYAGASVGATTGVGNNLILVDRTVLSSPLTVPARGNAALQYKLKCSYNF